MYIYMENSVENQYDKTIHRKGSGHLQRIWFYDFVVERDLHFFSLTFTWWLLLFIICVKI